MGSSFKTMLPLRNSIFRIKASSFVLQVDKKSLITKKYRSESLILAIEEDKSFEGERMKIVNVFGTINGIDVKRFEQDIVFRNKPADLSDKVFNNVSYDPIFDPWSVKCENTKFEFFRYWHQ